ncbi:MAG: glucokinase [Rhodospirillaceae bacterium]
MVDLLADIGGTNARVAFHDNGAWPRVLLRKAADFPSLEAMLLDVMAEAGVTPTHGAIALPGPVTGDAVVLTNLPWRVERGALAARLGLGSLSLLNDLEAAAWSLPFLKSGDIAQWRAGKAAPAARIVVAPGTGLGVGALAPHGGGWTAVPSEGGHAFAIMPTTTPEPLRALWRERPSWEDLLSGPGLLRIFRALGGTAETPAAVTAAAENNDARAAAATGFFSKLLGICAGEMAIVFGAKGGCYVAGGVVPALGRHFDVARFISGFNDKGPYTSYVDTIPLGLIIHPYPALVGLAGLLSSRCA